jgi:hypothetical protein
MDYNIENRYGDLVVELTMTRSELLELMREVSIKSPISTILMNAEQDLLEAQEEE